MAISEPTMAPELLPRHLPLALRLVITRQERLRSYLRLCELLGAEGMDELLEARQEQNGRDASHIQLLGTDTR
jgi:hypothetical protein